jgi:hypothetical protein
MHLWPDMDYPKLIRRYFRGAQSREVNKGSRLESQATTIMKFNEAVSKIPELALEYRLVQSSLWRQNALLHDARTTKFNDLLAFLTGNVSRIVQITGLFLVAVFLQQQYPHLIEPLTGDALHAVAKRFPELPAYSWILIFLVVLYIHRNLKMARARLSEAELRQV